MNERDLRYFCQLIETGSYTQTAAHFHITQPAISAAVKRLEAEYDLHLVTQENHRSQLVATPAGRILYVKAKHLLKTLSQIALEVQHAAEPAVRLGFSNVAGRIWLPRVLKRFVTLHLLDEVVTTTNHSETLLDDLRHGKLDAAVLSTLGPENEPDLRAITLEKHPFRLLVNRHHPLHRLKVIHATDLQDVPIIARPPHTLPRQALTAFCRQPQVHPQIIYEATTNELVESIVAQNIGVGLAVENSLVLSDQVVSRPLAAAEQPHCYMQLVVRKSFIPNVKQQQCLDILKAVSHSEND